MEQISDKRNILPIALYIACIKLNGHSLEPEKITEARNSLIGEALLWQKMMTSEERKELDYILLKLFGNVDQTKLIA